MIRIFSMEEGYWEVTFRGIKVLLTQYKLNVKGKIGPLFMYKIYSRQDTVISLEEEIDNLDNYYATMLSAVPIHLDSRHKNGTCYAKLTEEESILCHGDDFANTYYHNLTDWVIAMGILPENPTLQRAFSMPTKNTFQTKVVRELIQEEMEGSLEDVWVDFYANNADYSFHLPGVVTNDLNTKYDTDYHMEAAKLAETLPTESTAGVILDWPYSPRQVKECYESVGLGQMLKGGQKTNNTFWTEMKDQAARIIKPGGKVITFGWNTTGLGMSRGFQKKRILMVAHGGEHNDTLVTVEIKRYDAPKYSKTQSNSLVDCKQISMF